MPLTAGTRIGPYEIVSAIGAGGMGEVYRATDTNLKRVVAIKVLPAAVASEPDRLARFQREAELLAALTHPNIAQIYGLERPDGNLRAISMEGDHSEVAFLHSDASESQGQFFPRVERQSWIAYTSNESGRDEVFLRTFPDAGNMQVVSRNGGHSPRWRADGRELLYVTADGTIMAATFDPSTGLGVPVALFKAPSGFASRDATGYRSAAPWAVTPDGQRFLFAVPEAGGSLNQLTVVLNWQAGS